MIKWSELSNIDVQLATVLYNSRINDYKRMRLLTDILDSSQGSDKDSSAVIELAEIRIRQLNAFRELSNYNMTGTWLGLHPLVTRHNELLRLKSLKQTEPVKFLSEQARNQRNIRRYKSYISDDKRKDRRSRDQELLDFHLAKQAVFEIIISNKEP